MNRTTRVVALLGAVFAWAAPARAQWQPQRSGTTAELRALLAVSERVVWAAGRGGVFVRTLDGGSSWRSDTVPGAGGLFFIGVAATGADTAWLAGTSFADSIPDARLYRTDDGGRNWRLQWRSTRAGIFLDGVRCWDARRAAAFGDALDGRMLVLSTSDAGATWTRVDSASIPAALPGEAGFAASGTALAASRAGGRGRPGERLLAWIGTGGGGRARVYRTQDGGRSWSVASTPMPAGTTAGIFGVAFRDERHGIAVGGDYSRPRAPGAVALRTGDGGGTWTPAGPAAPAGVRYGVAYVPGTGTPTLMAVGPSGSGYSTNDGGSWTVADTVAYNTVSFATASAGWAAGPDGRIARWRGRWPVRRP
jgi:photosystem II stability/assembly factor-like uncharacterized protein